MPFDRANIGHCGTRLSELIHRHRGETGIERGTARQWQMGSADAAIGAQRGQHRIQRHRIARTNYRARESGQYHFIVFIRADQTEIGADASGAAIIARILVKEFGAGACGIAGHNRIFQRDRSTGGRCGSRKQRPAFAVGRKLLVTVLLSILIVPENAALKTSMAPPPSVPYAVLPLKVLFRIVIVPLLV